MWDLPAFEITQHDAEGMQRTPATVCGARYIVDHWPEVMVERPTRETAERNAAAIRAAVDMVRAAKVGLTQKMLASVFSLEEDGCGCVILFDRSHHPVWSLPKGFWVSLCNPLERAPLPPAAGATALDVLAERAREGDAAGATLGTVLTVSSGAIAVGVTGDALSERIRELEAQAPEVAPPARAVRPTPHRRAFPLALAVVALLAAGGGLPPSRDE